MQLPSPSPFLDALFSKLHPDPHALDHLVLDHLCYRVETTARYETLRDQLLADHKLLVESIINGRRIATFRMAQPFKYQQRNIWLLELPEPKPSSPYREGWEHAEFVTDRPLTEFGRWLQEHLGVAAAAIDASGMDKALNADLRLRLPGSIGVKFHELSLDQVINIELAGASEQDQLPLP